MFSGIVPVVKAYIVDSFPADDVPRVLAYREAAGTLAFVIGPCVGGVLASRQFAAPLFFSAAAGAVATVLAAVGLVDFKPRARGKGSQRRRTSVGSDELCNVPSAVRVAAPIILLSFVWSCTRTCFHAYYPLLLARRYPLSVASIGYLLTVVSLFVAAIQVCGFDRCRRWMGLRPTLGLGGLLVSVGLAALGITPAGAPLGLLLAVTAVYAAGVALLAPAVPAMLLKEVPRERCGMLLGAESAVVNFGRIVAPPLFGLLPLRGALGVVGSATGLATIAVWLAPLAPARRAPARAAAKPTGPAPGSAPSAP